MFFLSNTLLGLQFAYIGNPWFFVFTRGQFLIIAILIDNFPTASSLNFYIVCSTTILVLIAPDCERFSKIIIIFFSKFKEDAKIIIFCLPRKLTISMPTAKLLSNYHQLGKQRILSVNIQLTLGKTWVKFGSNCQYSLVMSSC